MPFTHSGTVWHQHRLDINPTLGDISLTVCSKEKATEDESMADMIIDTLESKKWNLAFKA
jgi:hypothetical protein